MISDALLILESLKKERNAVILAQYAMKTDADVILFCSVHFMCETAKILNPDKRLILPNMDAGCYLADSVPPKKFKTWINSYINFSVWVKSTLILSVLHPMLKNLSLLQNRELYIK